MQGGATDRITGGVTESNSFTLSELCEAVPLPPTHPTPAALLAHIRRQLHEVVTDLFTAARSRATAAVGFFPLVGARCTHEVGCVPRVM